MANKVEKVLPFGNDDLDRNAYVISLLQKANVYGLISDVEIRIFKQHLYLMLGCQSDRYMEGRSSSIPKDTAQQLLESILYVIGMALQQKKDVSVALQKLMTSDLSALYEQGLTVIRKKMNLVRTIQKSILNNLAVTVNGYYQSTIEAGINAFFDLYSPQYGAHLIHITADYPTMAPRPSSAGIQFMEEYLKAVQIENEFMKRADPSDLHHIMLAVNERYATVPLNLCQPVLLSALGRVLCEKDPKGFVLCEVDVRRLETMFSTDTENNTQLLNQAMDRLISAFHIRTKESPYFKALIPSFAKQISQAVEDHTLHRMFVVPAKEPEHVSVTLSYGNRMSDEKYSELSHFLKWCEDPKEKVEKVKENLKCLSDLLDLLDDELLNQDECNSLIAQMDASAKQMLSSYVSQKEFMDDPAYMIASSLLECEFK